MSPLDRSSPLPLWAQLEDALRVRLDAGEFDDRFPTDHELVAEYDVSRHTVREAIRHLNESGILRRERGRGTVVDRVRFEQPLGTLYSLFRSIESSGAEQRSRVLTLDTRRQPAAAESLGLDVDAEFVHLERLRLADGEPLAVDRAWIPLPMSRPLLGADFTHTALYDELHARCGVRPDAGRERITPVLPRPAVRELLDMRRGEAAFLVERLATASGVAVEWRETVLRGERFRLVADFAAGSSTTIAAIEPTASPPA